MTIPLLEKERIELVTRMKSAHEDDRQADFDELKAKVEQLDKRIANQTYLDEQSVRATPVAKADSDLSTRIRNDYQLGKAIRGQTTGKLDGLEGEVQTELRSRPGNDKHPEQAILIPDELMETRAVTAGSSGAQIATESYRPQEFLPVLRDRSIAGALGIRMIQGTGNKVRVPRQGPETSASWVGESGAVSATDMTFLDPIEFEAHRLSYHTSHSDQVVRESGGGLPIQRLILEEAQRAMADKIDESIFSTRTTQESNAPDQLWRIGSVGSIAARTRSGDTNGKAITYADILALKTATANANMPMMRPGFAINPDTADKLKQELRISSNTNSDTIIPGGSMQIDGYPTQVSTRVTNSHTKGTGTVSLMFYSSDWQFLTLCTWGSTSLIVDPYSSAPSATVRFVWSQYMDYKILRNDAFGWYDSVLLS